MIMNTYFAEKMMEQRQLEIEKATRIAWYRTEINQSNVNKLSKLKSIWRRSAYTSSVEVSESCCSCC